MVTCHILSDGGNEADYCRERLDLVPEHQWISGPITGGKSGVQFGDRWVKYQDIPPPKLEEVTVGASYLKPDMLPKNLLHRFGFNKV